MARRGSQAARMREGYLRGELSRPLGATPTHRQLEVRLARRRAHGRGAAALLGIQTNVRWHLARLSDRGGCVDEAMASFRHRDEPRRPRAS